MVLITLGEPSLANRTSGAKDRGRHFRAESPPGFDSIQTFGGSSEPGVHSGLSTLKTSWLS